MTTHIIKEGINSVGVQNPNLRVFDIIMQTEFGTTYNAYVVQGDKKTALIETSHSKFFDEYFENVSSICDLKNVDYVVLNHTEPDHSGSLRRILEINPNIIVVATVAGTNNIKQITNMEFKSQIARDGDVIDLGGKTLKFLVAPMLHWPDSMFTYVEEDEVLFSCDFLGAHYCETKLFDKYVTQKENYDKAFAYYYAAIFGPFKSAVLNGLDKIKNLKFDTVCTSHGPVLTDSVKECIDKYREWSSEAVNLKNDPKEVSIFYVSAYGCTRQMASIAKEVIENKGMKCRTFDVIKSDMGEIKEAIDTSDAIMLGTPTINRDALKPIWDVISTIDAVWNRGKNVGVFGSFGWSGEGVPMVVNRINDLKLKAFENGFKACFVPSDDEINGMKTYTEKFIELI
ncbi:MAG: FprA family A-type flavoprotein [Oscillospiraceae bacterium]